MTLKFVEKETQLQVISQRREATLRGQRFQVIFLGLILKKL
jgi:hypothetical protein